MPTPRAADLATLQTTIASTRALINQFSTGLQQTSSSLSTPQPQPPNALALISDAAKVLKAQTTKLSLLVLNKPFTPSEITFILNSLCRECIPAFVSAAQICPATKYTTLLHNHIRSSVGSVLRELVNLLGEIPTDERGIEKTRGRDTLASTGVIWRCCDSMVDLGTNGSTTYALLRIKEFEDLFKDAMEELQSWQKEEMGNSAAKTKQDKDSLQETYGIDSLAISDEDSFGPTEPAPESVKLLTAKTVEVMKAIRELFPMLRRPIARFPRIDSKTKPDDFPNADQTKKMDSILESCQAFCDEADEIAGALYQHDEVEVKERLESLKDRARDCVDEVRENWHGERDDFSTGFGDWMTKLYQL